MDKNTVYKSLYLHYVEGKKLREVSQETGLVTRVVLAILKGLRMPEVANDFFTDRKTGDYSRSYPEPDYKVLDALEYAQLEQRYMSILYTDKVDFFEVSSYLLEDDVAPEQRERMMRTLTKFVEDKELEALDKKLQAVLDVLAQPSKWRMTDSGLVTVYPVPELDEELNVVGVKYQEQRAYLIPDELWNRFK